MDYNTIDVEAEVNAMVEAVERGEARPASKRESMVVALSLGVCYKPSACLTLASRHYCSHLVPCCKTAFNRTVKTP
jgi:hypothetical protein